MHVGTIDKSSPIPLYHQVESQIEAGIRGGKIPAGSHLPNEIDLARSFDVSRLTLRRAIQSLVAKGLLSRERGVGTRVLQASRVSRPLVTELTGLHRDLIATGASVRTRVLRLDRSSSDHDSAAALELEPGTRCLVLERLRLVDGRPIALIRNVFPEGAFDLTEEDVTDASLYDHMAKHGVMPRVANQTVTADLATPPDSDALEVSEGDPVLVLERLSFDALGTAIEHARTLYAADRYSFDMRLVTS